MQKSGAYQIEKLPLNPMMREQLSETIRTAIFEGKLRPGDALVESRLARELSVGQPTLREALQVLEHEGLLTRVARRGVFVTELSSENIESIFSLRAELEALAIGWAAGRAGPEQLGPSYILLDQMKQAALRGDVREYLRVDLQLHRSLWQLSGNSYLEKALEPIMLPLVAFSQITSKNPEPQQYLKNIDGHRELVELIRDASPARARRLAYDIIMQFKEFSLRKLKVAPDGEGGSDHGDPSHRKRKT